MTEKEHKKWHRENTDIAQAQHKTLMKVMGVSEEADKEWHKTHEMPRVSNQPGREAVNPFAVGEGFLIYCVKRGWLIQDGKGRNATYFATKEGEGELKKFGIEI